MGKITSGGLIGFDDAYKSTKSSSAQEPTVAPESWGEYATRNVAKIPALAYQTARSGLGVGDIINILAKRSPISIPGAETLRRGLLPTMQEANQEISQVLPKYYTESRPEDFWPEFALTTIPLMGKNALTSLPGLAKGGLQALTILGGAEAGKAIGGSIGEQFGDEELGQLVGGLGGGIGAHKLAGKVVHRPSSLTEKVGAKEKNLFEQGKLARLAQAEQEYGPKIAQLEKDRIKATLAVPKQKSAFDSVKKDSINDLRSDITNYKHSIDTLDKSRNANYKKAAELEKSKIGPTKDLMEKLKQVSDNMEHGVDMADQKLLNDNLGQLRHKAQKGELPLSIAKQFQKNFNDQIYNYNMSRNFKKYMGEVTQSLNEFIEQTGGPEHSKYWKQAEQETRQLKQLQRGQKDFIKEKNEVIRDILKEKFSPEKETVLKNDIKEATTLLKGTQKEFSEIKNAIGKETFEDLIKSQQKSNKITDFITEQIGSTPADKASKYGLAGLVSIGGYILGGGKAGSLIAGALVQGGKTLLDEMRTAREVMKNHPEIYKEYINLLKDYEKLPKVTVARHLTDIGKKIEEDVPEDYQPKKGGITKGGLL